MRPPWRYFIIDELGRSGTIISRIPTFVSQKRTILSPEGWGSFSIVYQRNLEKIGLVRSVTNEIAYILDAAEIVRDVIIRQNTEKKLYHLLQKLTLTFPSPGTHRWVYKTFYKGQLDLAKANGDDYKLSVPILEGGIQKQVKSHENNPQEISLDDPERILVRMDGIFLQAKMNWLLVADEVLPNHVPSFQELPGEGGAAGVAQFSAFEGPVTSENYIMTTTQAITGLRLEGVIPVSGAIPGSNVQLVIQNQNGTTVATLVSITATSSFQDVTVNVTFNGAPGDKFWLVNKNAVGVYGEATLSLSYKSKHTTTYVKALKPLTLANRLSEGMTGAAGNLTSTLLDAESFIVITSGDGVRGIENPKIKTSFTTFLQHSKVCHVAGMGIENGKIVIESYDHFLKTTAPVNIGNAKDFKWSVAHDLFCNRVKFGYPNSNIDDLNGKYSSHNTWVFSTPKSEEKELDLVDPYIADPYYIENKRINLEGKSTTDSQIDNDVILLNVEPVAPITGVGMTAEILFANFIHFDDATRINDFQPGGRMTISNANINNGTFSILEVSDVLNTGGFTLKVLEPVTPGIITGAKVDTGLYTLVRKPYAIAEGVPDIESLYNIEHLTPKRRLLAHMKWINSFCHGHAGEKLKLLTKDRNQELRTDDIDEDSDVEIGTDKYFLPYWFDFQIAEVVINLVKQMDIDMNTAFSTNWLGNTYSGITINSETTPATLEVQDYRMLSAPHNDLTNLI